MNRKASVIKEQSDTNIFSLKNIAKTLKPTIKKIIDQLNISKANLMRGKTNHSRSPNDSSFIKEKYINDLINEFEEDRSRSGSRKSSVSVSKKNSSLINLKNNQMDNSNSNNDNKNITNDIFNSLNKGTGLSKNNSPLIKPRNSNATAINTANKPEAKRTLKQMFSKAFNFSTEKKDVSNSRLAKLLQDAEDEQAKDENKNNANNKYQPTNINDIMTKIDNDKINSSEISIKNAKLNNSSFIDLNDEDEESNKEKFDIKKGMKNEMSKFVFNIISDNTNNDKYEFKTFYIKAENNDDNLNLDKNKNKNGKDTNKVVNTINNTENKQKSDKLSNNNFIYQNKFK